MHNVERETFTKWNVRSTSGSVWQRCEFNFSRYSTEPTRIKALLAMVATLCVLHIWICMHTFLIVIHDCNIPSIIFNAIYKRRIVCCIWCIRVSWICKMRIFITIIFHEFVHYFGNSWQNHHTLDTRRLFSLSGSQYIRLIYTEES